MKGGAVHTHSDGSGLQKLPDKKLTGNKKARLGSQETQALGLNSETAIISVVSKAILPIAPLNIF